MSQRPDATRLQPRPAVSDGWTPPDRAPGVPPAQRPAVRASRPDVTGTLRRTLVLTAVLDAGVLGFAAMVAWNLRQVIDMWTAPDGAGLFAQGSVPWIVVTWMVVLALQGAYSLRTFDEGGEEFRVVAVASFVTGGLVSMACYLLQLPLSRGFVLLAFVIGLPLLLLERYVVRRSVCSLRRSGRMVHRVVAVGGPSGISEVVDALQRSPEVGYRVVGAALPVGVAVEPERLTVPVLGSVTDARRLCEETGADTVLIARGGFLDARDLRRIAWSLEGSDIDLVVVPSLTDVAGPRIRMRPVAGLPLLHLEHPQADEASGWGKRVFDLVGATVALLLLAPLALVVTLLVKATDHGPVLFVQPRVGRDGRAFGCFKFRSMRVDAQSQEHSLRAEAGHDGALFKLPEDPRITRVGRFIRRYSVDEIPQLVNVLRGEMSLVGPRPQQAWEVSTYTDWEHRRLRVRPGMTGLWQVSGRSQLSFDEAIRLDLYYVDNWSMTQDLLIMAKTVRAVVGGGGAY